jgi:membrane-associated phospholipid phosphatase
MKTLRSLSPGLLISVFSFCLFALLAASVKPQWDGDRLVPQTNFVTEIDQNINEALHQANQQSPAAVRLFNQITDLGSGIWIKRLTLIVALGMVIIPCWMVIFHNKTIRAPLRGALLALVWTLALVVGEWLNVELKGHFMRSRPPYHEQAHAFGFSFPSGHSMGAFIAYGMLAYILNLNLVIRRRRIRRALVASLFLIVVLVGFSRVFLGAHWFSDVIGGFIAGACWLGFCIAGIESVRGIKVPAEAPLLEETVASLQPDQSKAIP